MKINFLTENTVEIKIEIKSTYNKNPAERKIFGDSFAIEEFLKRHPDKKVEKVQKSEQLNNFTKVGKVSGTWVLQLEKAEEPVKKQPQIKKTRKKKTVSLNK